MEKMYLRTNKGITIIVLIITIIIMLMLVGVSVTVTLDNGLFSVAQNATDSTGKEVQEEEKLANGMIYENGKEVTINDIISE